MTILDGARADPGPVVVHEGAARPRVPCRSRDRGHRLLQKLNIFRGLPNPREVWAWGMYDLANQSFQLLINTLMFVIYMKRHVAASPDQGLTWFGGMAAVGLLAVTILSPVAGAIADRRVWKMELLIGTGLVCAALTALLATVQPGMLWWAAVLYAGAALACGLGENFLGSFLTQVATPATMGRVSALGWSMSYVGALALLGIVAVVVFGLDVEDPSRWRWFFVFAGGWFVAGMVPAMLFLRERAAPPPAAARGSLIGGTVRTLVRSARETGRFRQVARYLTAFFVYSLGTNTVIYFAGSIGDDMAFGFKQLVLLALVMALSAGVGAVLAGRYQDVLGHRRTVLCFIAAWTVSTLMLAIMRATGGGAWLFWIIAGGLGLGLGGIGTASRAFMGVFTPNQRSGEFFGVYGTVYKLSGVIALVSFAWASTAIGKTPALFLLVAFFVAGFFLMLRVDERAGIEAARAAERDDPGGTGSAPPTVPA